MEQRQQIDFIRDLAERAHLIAQGNGITVDDLETQESKTGTRKSVCFDYESSGCRGYVRISVMEWARK